MVEPVEAQVILILDSVCSSFLTREAGRFLTKEDKMNDAH